ncbi:LytR C-terminal domain-containing protein [candidate division WWE3 bacterium]|uniref:LytR C-terminal domain-containing protein n=1 Tax=candidate division WWE3 bacterium TaxID=2053526 RepID=A0A955LKA1_UNCKA|nr:LytR C-terminal domain-containing protein [candidate division WWE3 bacterium]
MASWKANPKNGRKDKKRKKLRLIILGGVLIGLIIVVVRLIMWLYAIPQTHPDINIDKLAGWKNGQVNLYVYPDFFIGIDMEQGEIKYFRTEDAVDPSNALVEAKKLGVLVDGYIIFRSDLNDIDDFVSRVDKSVWGGESVYTNITRKDMFKLWSFVRGSNILQPQNKTALPETSILLERYNVVVNNATNVSGLASDASRWIENIGAVVVDTGNYKQTLQSTKINVYLPEKTQSRTVERLEEIFGVNVDYLGVSDEKPYDIEVAVGEDFTR